MKALNIFRYGVLKMEIPKTKAQQDFETDMQYLINVLSELNKQEIHQVINYAVFLANE